MKYLLVVTMLTFLAACQTAPTQNPQERRELCEHFAGEEPYDVERAAYLNEMYEKLDCREFEAGGAP